MNPMASSSIKWMLSWPGSTLPPKDEVILQNETTLYYLLALTLEDFQWTSSAIYWLVASLGESQVATWRQPVVY
jgi:hypothetical protein